jgi:uncharacterized protein YdhG (YjbR/CyaY superfamily)
MRAKAAMFAFLGKARTEMEIGGITMKADPPKPATIDDYIAGFPRDVQAILQKIRATIRKAAPHAQETISYRMPAFKQNGMLVYFAAFKKHIGLFPPVTGDAKLKEEASVYAGPKGNLQFPLDEPIPYALITRIVKARAKEDKAAAAAKAKKK